MSNKPLINENNAEIQGLQDKLAEISQEKRDLYPEVNDRLKGVVLWSGLGFVLLVLFLQYYSGYF